MKPFEAYVIMAGSQEVAKSGRHEAFGELVRRFQDMAYTNAFAILQDSQLAQDAAQEAFITAYQKLEQLQDPKAFPGWLRRIVRTHCNRMRRGKRLPTRPIDETGDVPDVDLDPATTIEKDDLRDRVLAAIESLPDHERIVVHLFYLRGYSLRETAETLQLPVTTIKKRLQYARRRLRKQVARGTAMACLPGFTSTMNHLLDSVLHQLKRTELIRQAGLSGLHTRRT
jgi:RNA polymerase sigma-70 factor (ECF subfamily)